MVKRSVEVKMIGQVTEVDLEIAFREARRRLAGGQAGMRPDDCHAFIYEATARSAQDEEE